jgi:two-component system KDP operon response regulator KdpE
MTTGSLILVIEDDLSIRRMLRISLGTQSFRVAEASAAAEGIATVQRGGVDAVVLDLGLPDIDGMEVLRRLRAFSSVPIVVLTARDNESSKVEAFELGADDYLTKPFGIPEFMARVRAALRHALQREGTPPVFRSGNLSVDLVRHVVSRDGQIVHLSPREYDILAMLVKHAGRIITHRQILSALWGGGGDVQQLRVYVRQLRQKIEDNPERPRHILTETGLGYRLATSD